MFDRFSDRARKALRFARQEAELGKCDYIGTEHILLGILREGDGLAATILAEQKADPGKIAARVRELSAATPASGPRSILPFTPRAKAALSNAVAVAEKFSHDYVGTQHLLLGVLGDKETAASQVLAEFALTEEVVTEAIQSSEKELAETATARGDAAAIAVSDRFASSDPDSGLPLLLRETESGSPFLLRNKVFVAAVTVACMAPIILLLMAGKHFIAIVATWGYATLIYSPYFRPHRYWGLLLVLAGIAHAVAALSISIIDADWLWVAWCWFAAVVSFYSGDAQLSLLKTIKPPAVVEEKS
jgi:hypothetical protein